MRFDRWETGFYLTLGRFCVGLVTYGGNWQLTIGWIDGDAR
jgi:hypothetical protein